MEVELNLHDLVQNTDSQLDWIKELYPHFRLKDKDNPRTPEEIIDDMEDICPSNLHGVFLKCVNEPAKNSSGCTINGWRDINRFLEVFSKRC